MTFRKAKSKKAKKTADLARMMIEPLRSSRYKIDVSQIFKTNCIVCGSIIDSTNLSSAIDAHFKEMENDPAHLIWKIMNS